jgi:hypothetical protein
MPHFCRSDALSMPLGRVVHAARRAAVPVVPQSLSCTPVTAGTGPAISSYDVDAAFMSFQPREGGIHAVWSGAGEASVTKVRFRR